MKRLQLACVLLLCGCMSANAADFGAPGGGDNVGDLNGEAIADSVGDVTVDDTLCIDQDADGDCQMLWFGDDTGNRRGNLLFNTFTGSEAGRILGNTSSWDFVATGGSGGVNFRGSAAYPTTFERFSSFTLDQDIDGNDEFTWDGSAFVFDRNDDGVADYSFSSDGDFDIPNNAKIQWRTNTGFISATGAFFDIAAASGDLRLSNSAGSIVIDKDADGNDEFTWDGATLAHDFDDDGIADLSFTGSSGVTISKQPSGGIVINDGSTTIIQITSTEEIILNTLTDFGVHVVTCADTGDASPCTATITPTANHVQITCEDADSCDITLGVSGVNIGVPLFIDCVNDTNNGTETCDFADGGNQNLAGAASLDDEDTLQFFYVALNRWLETSRSNN